MHEEDPHCPECGEPIGQTATYCMHCSADLTEERAASDTDADGAWDQTESTPSAPQESTVSGGEGELLDPDGLVDNTLTVAVAIVGGIVVGTVGTLVLVAVTGSGWAFLFGVLTWLAATAYLARCRTVQGAVSKGGYATAVVLLVVPIIALSPFVNVDGGATERGGLFVVLLVFVAVPAGFAAVVGWVASRYVPEGSGRDG